MMLIAISIVALACDAAPARIAAPPPLHITVWHADNVTASLARKMTEEVDAIWRSSGVTFVWEEAAPGRAPGAVEIIVNDDRGRTSSPLPPLGWILFDAHDVPDRLIHVSYANAVALLDDSSPVVGHTNAMPTEERETYLGRAMGRALAHELGHYLLASKAHTARGLMQGTLSATALFSPIRELVGVPPAMCDTMMARLRRSGSNVASP